MHKCPYSNSKDFKTNTALVLAFLPCTLICGFAFKSAICHLCTRRRHHKNLKGIAEEQEPRTLTLVYSEGMKLAGEAAESAICLSEFSVDEKIRVLEKCSHGFHVQCIVLWLNSHSSCPNCRANS